MPTTRASKAELAQALSVLEAGGIVCLPTESTYGLAVDVANPRALEALVDLKGRAATAPFALMAADAEQARAITGSWPEGATELAEQHWPGPLTLVLPPGPSMHESLIGPSGGVGVRVPANLAARSLARELGRPITATSANPSGRPAATTLAEAKSYFGEAVGYYLDGGRCQGQPSTLVDFESDGRAKLLRRGPISLP